MDTNVMHRGIVVTGIPYLKMFDTEKCLVLTYVDYSNNRRTMRLKGVEVCLSEIQDDGFHLDPIDLDINTSIDIVNVIHDTLKIYINTYSVIVIQINQSNHSGEILFTNTDNCLIETMAFKFKSISDITPMSIM
jgi:hypothetical protein